MTSPVTGAARLLLPSGLTLALLLGAAACGGSGSPAAGGAAPAASSSAVEQPTVTNGVQVLKVTGNEKLEFLQTHLAAKAGIPVRIEFTVTGGVPHNLSILDGPKAATPTFSSGTQSLTVTFAKPGTYHYQCTIHPGSMNGIITVS